MPGRPHYRGLSLTHTLPLTHTHADGYVLRHIHDHSLTHTHTHTHTYTHTLSLRLCLSLSLCASLPLSVSLSLNRTELQTKQLAARVTSEWQQEQSRPKEQQSIYHVLVRDT
jgi:hypothetical protein